MGSFDANTPLNTLKRLLGAESTVVSGSVGEAQFQPPPDLQTELIGSFGSRPDASLIVAAAVLQDH